MSAHARNPGDKLQPGTGGVGEASRGALPILEHTIYLNACSQGALSHRVCAAYEEHLDGWDENRSAPARALRRVDVAHTCPDPRWVLEMGPLPVECGLDNDLHSSARLMI
jgi:hypothetical protein